jgi:hypothetical protein
MDAQQLAEAFSSHRFREIYDRLADDVRWVLVGEAVIEGRSAVVEACEGALREFEALDHVEFTRFVAVGGPGVAAVDAIARYVSGDSASVVSSADVYELDEAGRVTTITSYAVELES